METIAIQIVEAFQNAGFEAYFAGGSVRDLLMGHEPKDYDIATSATPDEIEQVVDEIHLESKTIPIGKQFGVMLGLVHGYEFEIATFRSDSSSSDGRRPDAVLFTSAKEDAVRRDFTINGLFYDPIKKKVIDYVGGQKDIQQKVLRFIGEPHERVKEDHLRLLRAVRFKNQFGLNYAPRTEKALSDLPHLVQGLSGERVQAELTKMLISPNRSHCMKELSELGLLSHILPEVEACKGIKQPLQYHQEGDVFIHLLKSLHDIPEEWITKPLVWAVFLHDIGKPQTFKRGKDRIRFDHHAEVGAKMADDLLRRFKFSRLERTEIVWLIAQHMSIAMIPKMRWAHQVDLFMNPWFEALMQVHYADEHGSLPIDLSLYKSIMKTYREFKDEKLLETHFKPLLNGNDLMEKFNLKPGPQLKKLLESLRHAQIEGEVKTLEEAEEFIQKQLTS